MSILIGVAVLGLCVIALAWLDAGREEQRLIVAPVIAPLIAPEAAR